MTTTQGPRRWPMLLDQVQASSSREAFRYLEGERWISLTWQETKDKAFQLAAGLISLGVGPEDRVALASGTRMEWILADLAIMCAGAATTTIYPTTQHEDVAFILGDSGSKVVTRSMKSRSPKYLIICPSCPTSSRSSKSTAGPMLSCHRLGGVRRTRPPAYGRPSDSGRRCHCRYPRRPVGDSDLHVGHHRPPQGSAAAAGQLDVRRSRDRGVRHHQPR